MNAGRDVVRYQLRYRSSEPDANVPTSDRVKLIARVSSSAELKRLGVVVERVSAKVAPLEAWARLLP